jgi:hypothetical protein
MEHGRFEILFQKLESVSEDFDVNEGADIIKAESEEISELRRIILETLEIAPKFYTTT